MRRPPAFVTITTSSRTPASATRVPSSSSAAPEAYTSAVSNRVPPASTNSENWSRASYSSVSRPQVIVPRPVRLTCSPLRPTALLSMARHAIGWGSGAQ